MHQKQLALLLFTPSLLSGSVTLSLAIALNGYGAWTFIRENQLFYGFISGAYGIQTYLGNASYGVSAWSSAFLNSPHAYYALVGGVAIAAGLAVFTLLQLLGIVKHEGQELLQDTPANRINRREVLNRFGLRVISIIGWALYAAFFISTLLPFVSVLNELGIEAIGEDSWFGWVQCVLSFLLLAVAIHLHVVLLRLIVLRPRLFGGTATIEGTDSRRVGS